jgi:hypothetical protein
MCTTKTRSCTHVLPLQEFRWDCDRLFGALCDPTAHLQRHSEVDALLRRLNTVRAHCLIAEDVPALLLKQCGLTDAWWHFAALKRDFTLVSTTSATHCLLSSLPVVCCQYVLVHKHMWH